jgi:flagellar hook-basal body complex protein FliE
MVVEFEKASIALNLLIQVRNKLVEAFQELNRMQV